MKKPDLDRERCEKLLTLSSFLKTYNEDLPEAFPRATEALLTEFRNSHGGLFRNGQYWSLDQHRKKIMDWLPMRLREA